MLSIHDTAYPRLKSHPSAKELEARHTPTPDELELARWVTSKPSTSISSSLSIAWGDTLLISIVVLQL
jgi:hypothetical protein